MGNVIQVAAWGSKKELNIDSVKQKLHSCDRFIRSRFIPPPLGNVVFNFASGKVTVCHTTTCISGEDCQVVIRGSEVQIIGETDDAIALFCAIHREIENLNPHAVQSA